jgi:integrase
MTDGRTKTTWYVILELGRDESGRRRQKWHGGYRTRREAEAARAKLVNEVNTGIYAEPTKVTLDEWTRGSWLPTVKSQVKPTTWASYDRMLRLHVLPVLGDRPLHKLTSTLLNALYADLMESGYKKESRGGGLHPKTVRHIHSTLHKVLGDAIDAGLLTVNPADRAKPPRPRASSPTEMKFWDADQLGQFLAHIQGKRLEAAWHLLAMTGMRRGEVLGLRWHDVDLDDRRLAVRHTITTVGYEIRESTPKTHQARTIDLDPGTVERLRQHRQRQTPEKDAWGPGYQDSDLVFRREDGSPVHPQLFSQAFEREVRELRAPQNPTARPPSYARDDCFAGRCPRQGDQRATRPRGSRLHDEAVRARDPRHASRGRISRRSTCLPAQQTKMTMLLRQQAGPEGPVR